MLLATNSASLKSVESLTQTLLVKTGIRQCYPHMQSAYVSIYLQSSERKELEHPAQPDNNSCSLETKQPFCVYSTPVFSSRIVNAILSLIAGSVLPQITVLLEGCQGMNNFVSIPRITSVGKQLRQICSVMQASTTFFLSSESHLRHDYAAPAKMLLGVSFPLRKMQF